MQQNVGAPLKLTASTTHASTHARDTDTHRRHTWHTFAADTNNSHSTRPLFKYRSMRRVHVSGANKSSASVRHVAIHHTIHQCRCRCRCRDAAAADGGSMLGSVSVRAQPPTLRQQPSYDEYRRTARAFRKRTDIRYGVADCWMVSSSTIWLLP